MGAKDAAAVVPLHTRADSADQATEPAELYPFPVGTLLADRFRLTAILAVGGTSCIYRAVDQYTASTGIGDADVAIKVPRRLADGELGTDLACREVALCRRIRHRNVLNVFDLHQHKGRFFVSAEMINGEPLRERLRRAGGSGLERREYRLILSELVAAIAAMHDAGVVHSDLKPGNVLLERRGELRLIDLATARRLTADATLQPAAYQGYSPPYASPQALQDMPAHPADDVYSLGCLVYEMVAGNHPFDRHSALEASSRGLRPRRPRGLGLLEWRVLRRALAFRRDRRYASATAFHRAFMRARYLRWLLVGVTATALALVIAVGLASGVRAPVETGSPAAVQERVTP